MKRIAVAILSAVALLSTTACKKEKKNEQKQEKKADKTQAKQKAQADKKVAKAAANKKEEAKAQKVKDPVCGMDVDPNKVKFHMEYKGHKYHFCSEACLNKFKKEPEKYLAAKDKEHKDMHKDHKKKK